MGAFFLVLHHTSINLKWILIIFFRVFSGDWHLPAKLVMSFWFLSDVAGMILDSGSGGGVAFSAHVGGFLGGMLLMLIIKHTVGFLPDESAASTPAARATVVATPATMMLWVNGSQLGPLNRSQIRQMLELGSIDPGALYWAEGMEDWRSVQDL